MPVQPDISLGVVVPPPGGVAGSSPLDTISKFAGIQNALNQNSLFQQTFAARKAMGEIMATSPSLDAGLAKIMASPWAPFGAEFANTARQMQNTMLDVATKQQAGQQSGLSFVLKQMALGASDPTALEDSIKSGLATVPEQFRPAVTSSVSSLVKSLGYGMTPGDTTGNSAKYSARMVGLLTAAGYTPEAIHEFTGAPVSVKGLDPTTGLATEQGAVRRPAWAGGGLVPGGAGIITGMTPGEAVTTHTGPVNPLTGQPTAVTGGDIFRGRVPGLGGAMPAGAPAGASSSPSDYIEPPTGTPSLPPTGAPSSPAGAASPAGAPTALAPGQTQAIEGAAKNYTDEGRKAYDAAVTGLASVQYMDRAFNELSKGNGWETPGTAVNARLGIAKGINTLAQVFGTSQDKLPFDSGKIATWEEFNKETKRAGMQLINQMFGAQRESQMVFQAGTAAVPSAENTPAGGKLVLKSLEQTMLREVDRRNFETNWWNTHSGNLVGANEAFNSTYKPQLYANRAISSVQPYEVSTPEEASGYLPGTLVKRKGDGKVFEVTPQISKLPQIELGR